MNRSSSSGKKVSLSAIKVANANTMKHFEKYFICNDIEIKKRILSQHSLIWQHPLVLSHNYCLICFERCDGSSTDGNHIRVDREEFFKGNKIYFKPMTMRQKLSRRRDIKSQGKINYRPRTTEDQYYSDTDVVFKTKTLIKRKYSHLPKKHSALTKIETEKLLTTNDDFMMDKPKFARKKSFFSIDGKNKTQNFTSSYKVLDYIKSFAGIKTESKFKRHSITRNTVTSRVEINTSEEMSSCQSNVSKDLRKKTNRRAEYCDICFQDVKDKFTLPCGDFYCSDCLKSLILTGINTISQFNNIKCPKSICNEKIKENVICRLLNEDEFAKYTKIATRVDGMMNPNNIPCPIPDCEDFSLRSSIWKNTAECGKGHKFCIKCDKEHKTNHRCSQMKDINYTFLSNNQFIKKCPKCRTWVEKDKGCNNMTCTNIWCNFQFCWICDKQYDKSHYKNPFSACFGLAESDEKSTFAQNKCIRISKCLLLCLLIIFGLLPIIILLFSVVMVAVYILFFVIDGSAMKNLKLKTENRHKIFKLLVFGFYITISIALIPFGYTCFVLLLIISPFLCIYKKCKQEEENEIV